MINNRRETYADDVYWNSEEEETSNWVMNERNLHGDFDILNELREYARKQRHEKEKYSGRKSMSKGVETGADEGLQKFV